MKLVVAATAEQRQELIPLGKQEKAAVAWIDDLENAKGADVVIDLLFDSNPGERLELLKKLPAKMIAINDVCGYAGKLQSNFIRINGWPTFLGRPVIEAYCENTALKPVAEDLFSLFDKKPEWLSQAPGFITARIISMIVNEAYFANMEDVSSREEIDIAMKTGTNYPYGPFEWSRKIGIKKIYGLLKKLEETDEAYKPCDLLTKEAIA